MSTALGAPLLNVIDYPSGYSSSRVTTYTLSPFTIIDTLTHDASTDAGLPLLDLRICPGYKVIMAISTLNQACTIQLVASFDGTTFYTTDNTLVLNAGSKGFFDTSKLTSLLYPYPYLGFQLSCTTAPTSGSMTLGLAGASI